MSRYYSGTDYAASLPAAASYSSGFTSLFAAKAQSSWEDHGDARTGSDSTKYDNRRVNEANKDASRSPFLRRCYQLLATAFVALLLADLFQNQQLPTGLSSVTGGGVGAFGGNGTGSVGMGAAAAGKRSGAPREALEKLMLFGRHGASPGRFDQPKGLILVRNRFLFVSDFANKRLQMLHFHDDASAIKGEAEKAVVTTVDEAGAEALAEPVFEYAMEMDQVGGPWALAALDDYIFVAEWGMHRVKILKLDSKTGQLRAEGFFGQ
jgi:hypothetical protein